MKAVEVYLLAHSPAFQRFTYRLPEGQEFAVGDLVVVPFRSDFVAGVIGKFTQDFRNGLLPVAGRVTCKVPFSHNFGKILLCMANLYFCSPGEMFDLVSFGQASRRISLFFFTRKGLAYRLNLEPRIP